ncbi:hypothetical protein DSO57_1032872 [Entomophthora muscae]|uniref:Uncharacterized protein n=2 Tax=Entomophthora muscae TaxID=34485 RepID=A0ACC2SEG9_9FUNG|nr:hypothetical protein DSO57_1029604 [Entomophthora muscae]KAJ9083615.1 hypothetical protein DSO57_1032872 [Entomophthora muscae]
MIAEKVNVVVLGSGGVGKSSITISFINGEYDPTIEDSYSKNITVDGKEYQLDITDTAGQEEYRGLWSDKFLRGGDGFVLVYTITLKSSFDELTPIRAQVMRAREEVPCPMIVVGNKCDLVDLREVTEQDAADFADKHDALHIESSAKAKINIEEIFVELVREIVKRNTVVEVVEEVVEEEPVKAGCCAIL